MTHADITRRIFELGDRAKYLLKCKIRSKKAEKELITISKKLVKLSNQL